MELEQAIETAIAFENEVRDTYRAAAERAEDPVGRKVFATLAREEQFHVDYLEGRLAEWRATGRVTAAPVRSLMPSAEAVDEAIRTASRPLQDYDHRSELAMLQRAVEMEVQVGRFYERMVAELPPGQRELFHRFLDIEAGHQRIVQSEIDAVTRMGFWFGIPEFALEAE